MQATTYAVIDTLAIKHNLSLVRQYAAHSKIMAIIKANAYGHGLFAVAEALQEGVDAFGVARVDEGIQLRKAGISNKITILEGFTCQQELDSLVQLNLDAVIHSDKQIKLLQQQVADNKISVWLKLDVGMNRLGFNAAEFKTVYEKLQRCRFVKKPLGLMTHLSCADDPDSLITAKQIAVFNDSVSHLDGEKSIANSAAIISWPDAISDWVRPGIMLYGVSPLSKEIKLQLKPVMSLYSRIIAIKHIQAGEAVGYSGAWVSPHNTRLGVVAVGYGDGYPRYAKNGTPVLVNGERVPLVGRVSMDMITVDLANQANAKVGDTVTLWGKNLAVEEIARYADTIPYTLTCGITQRVTIETLVDNDG